MVPHMKKREYYDLHLKPVDEQEAIQMLHAANYMGYTGIGLNISNLITEEKFNTNELEKKANRLGVKIIYILESKKISEKNAKRFDPLRTINIDFAENEKEFRKKLKNPNLQVISISLNSIHEIINTSNLNLLKQTNKAIEIILKPLWLNSAVELQRLLKNIYKVTWLLNKKNKIYVSSGATKLIEMRNPLAIRSYLKLLGIKDEKTIYMLSELPSNIVFETKTVIQIESNENTKNEN